jgi:hypothetical protein
MTYLINSFASKEQGRERTAQSKKVKLTNIQFNRQIHLNWVVKKIEIGTGYSISELKRKYTQENLFFIAAKQVTTTKKSLCKALEVEAENCCRHKRKFELKGLLVESVEDYTCNYTGHQAKLISTNPNKFNRLLMSNQLKFEFSYE